MLNDPWIDQEIGGSKFADERLGKRFRRIMERLSQGTGESLPYACQDWANTKAAYRFFSNPRVSEAEILAGHFESTRQRFAQAEGKILLLHDTTEFSYQRERPDEIGVLNKMKHSSHQYGGSRFLTTCGILMHSSLAVTQEGLPLGLAAIKFWTRKKFKGCNALKKKINPMRVPIGKKESIRWLENLRQSTELFNEPGRCVHIGDRESDIFELFCAAEDVGTHFLVRTCADRLAGEGSRRVSEVMEEVRVKGHHWIEVKDKDGRGVPVMLEIKCQRMQILPPTDKSSKYPPLMLTVIHARELGVPKGRERIHWKLITNLSVKSPESVIEKIRWYALRWKIEVFHKILKSGCKIEESKMRTAQRLTNLTAVFCILAWRIFWITMIQRTDHQSSPALALTDIERSILDKLSAKKESVAPHGTLSVYLIKIAKLGGYLARTNDPPPGIKVMWRGLARLVDIELGFMLAKRNVGN